MKFSSLNLSAKTLARGLGLMLLLLSGCASQIPAVIKRPPTPDIGLDQVKKDIGPYQDQHVRWGGEIISVENRADTTLVEILANPLKSHGRPHPDNAYQGRFIARVAGFLDPEHYKKGSQFTVYGKVENIINSQIDQHPYHYPLVNAETYYLWPEYRYRHDYPAYRYPYYYGPYYRHHFGFYHLHY